MKGLGFTCRRGSLAVVGIVVAGLAVAGRSDGQETRRPTTVDPVATVGATGQALTFTPKLTDAMRLTVSGPQGVYWERGFAAGEAPTFILIDDRGPLPDGRYKYELRTQPPVDERLLQIAEETDDERLRDEIERDLLTRVVIQTGRFEVASGSPVLPPRDTASSGSEAEDE